MDKIYNQKEIEGKWYKFWEENGFFKPEINPDGKPYTIILPPPNANAPLHFGHAMYVVEDILIRYHRMKGYSTLWLPGADHAGFETQVVFEKQLEKQGKSRFDYDRTTLYQMIWDFVQENKGTMEGQLRRLGFSLDWSRYKFTLDPDIIKIVNKTFKKLYGDGLLYRAQRLVNYCTKNGTSFSDLEVIYEERKDKFYYLRYPLANSKNYIIIATTRPETMLGDTAIAVNPKDKRYKHLIGKEVELPLVNKVIPIIADSAIEIELGTGAEKVTPAHDLLDFELGQKHNLEQITVINFDGTMAENTGKYAGLKIDQARKAILEDLEALGLVEKIEDYAHRVGVCYKCGTPIQPLLKEQWFIKVKDLAKTATDVVKKSEIKIYPKNWETTYFNWLENIKDWNISRQIVWGIQIPAWYCGGVAKSNIPHMGFHESVVRQVFAGKTKTYRLKDHLLKIGDKVAFENSQEKKLFGYGVITNIELITIGQIPLDDQAHGATYKTRADLISAFKRHYPPETKIDKETSAIIYSYKFLPFSRDNIKDGCGQILISEEKPKKCPACNSNHFVQDQDTFDTWFSSGQWPFATLQTTNSSADRGDFAKFYPTSVMETMYDILLFWVARMVMLGIYTTGKIPFNDVILHGKVLDPLGKKMSKSKGNVVNPLEIADQYGADAARMALVYGTAFGHDQALSHPKLQAMRNFTNKLWNIGRFIIEFKPEETKNLESSIENLEDQNDKWIMEQLNNTLTTVTQALDQYRFHDAADGLYQFIWHDLADKYIESAKNRRAQAQPVLEYVFRTSLELLHPFMPFITEELWQRLPHADKSIMITQWPKSL